MVTRTHPGFRVFADGLLPLLSNSMLESLRSTLEAQHCDEFDDFVAGMPVHPAGWPSFLRLWDGYTREYLAWRLAELIGEELKRRADFILTT